MSFFDECFSFYNEELKFNRWVFTYKDGFEVHLSFPLNSIPHLMGLDKLEKYKLHAIRRKQSAKGTKTVARVCIDDIKNGILRNEMIQADPNRAEVVRRMTNFLKILEIIDDVNTTHCHFNQNLVPCKIAANFMLYNSANNLNLNLGLVNSDKNNTTGLKTLHASAITVFDEPDGDKYICNQQITTLKDTKVFHIESAVLVKSFE